MARTLTSQRRKEHKKALTGTGRLILCGDGLKRKSILGRWMNPFQKKAKSLNNLIIIDSSDDEEPDKVDAPAQSRHNPVSMVSISKSQLPAKAPRGTYQNAIEIDDSSDDDDMSVTYCEVAPLGPRKSIEVSTSDSEDDVSKIPSTKANYVHNGKQQLCTAITRKGKACMFRALDNTPYCGRHGKTLLKNTSTRSGQVSPTERGSSRKQAKDTLYRGKGGQFRCIAISGKGQLCPYQCVDKTVYCYGHADLSQVFFPSSSQPDEETSTDDSDESDSDSSESDASRAAAEGRPYKYKDFMGMWHDCEEYFGEMTEDIESTRRVRGANSRMAPEDTDGQLKAQYGRLLPRAMKKLMSELMGLKKEDVFLDIGHGIGNTCIQAAFTVGCEARGIEVVYDRNSVAEVFRDNLYSQNKDNPHPRKVGEIILRHGRLEEEEHLDFLTKGVTRAYVNNFNGVFAERSTKGNQKWFLDDYVAGLFALMAPGTIMITLHPLTLGPTKSEANNTRKKQGLSQNENASFYEVEKVLLGKACDTVKWNQLSGNQKNIYVYKYTRVAQTSDEAVFLCCNPNCDHARRGVLIPATTKNEEMRIVMNHCECRFTAKNLRRQERKDYAA